MLFSELLDYVLTDIDESSEDLEITKKLKTFINRGYRELAKREQLQKSKSLTLVDGKTKIPTDCYKVLAAYSEGIPTDYKIVGKYIVSDNTSIDLIYSYIPDALEDNSDETETNEGNYEFILLYAKYLYYLSESLVDEATILKKECENYSILKNDARIEKIIDVYGVV